MSLAEIYMEKGLQRGMQKGIEQGIEKGIQKEKYAIVQRLLSKEFSLTDIAEIVGLPIEQIAKLPKKRILLKS